MTKSYITTIGSIFALTFALWYLLRRTTIGSAYSKDMLAIPQQLGVAEGLKSASRYIK